jgi:hypothetical protein
MLGEGEPPVCAPEVQELVDGYLLMRATGRPPWEAGLRLGRSRFWQATRVLARVFEQAALLRLRPGSGCPLLGGGDL